VSTDGGKVWQRSASSLILPGPPEEHKDDIISWRDPYIAAWPEMDRQLGLEEGCFLYGLISGGLKDKTPTAFLYKIPRNNLRSWTFISTVADVGLHFRLDEKNGDMGQNWEVCNFFSMQQQHFMLMNVEGVGLEGKDRHAMWCCVEMKGSQLTPSWSGLLDHGCLYAATTFVHEPTKRRILWGWITEDDLAESRYHQQGWSGCMSLPRELVLLTYKGVDREIQGDSFVISNFQVRIEADTDAVELQTLGWRPVEETKILREGAEHFVIHQPRARRLPIQSRNFELEIVCSINSTYQLAETDGRDEVGILLCHNQSLSQYTKCIYSNGCIRVIRSQSTNDVDVTTAAVAAPIKLLPFADGTTELIRMHLFLDNSVLEVFVNDRVAITTRIYCDDDDSVHATLFNSEPRHAQFHRVEAWVGLQPSMIGDNVEEGLL
jgi:beta-fructofuranosidase